MSPSPLGAAGAGRRGAKGAEEGLGGSWAALLSHKVAGDEPRSRRVTGIRGSASPRAAGGASVVLLYQVAHMLFPLSFFFLAQMHACPRRKASADGQRRLSVLKRGKKKNTHGVTTTTIINSSKVWCQIQKKKNQIFLGVSFCFFFSLQILFFFLAPSRFLREKL